MQESCGRPYPSCSGSAGCVPECVKFIRPPLHPHPEQQTSAHKKGTVEDEIIFLHIYFPIIKLFLSILHFGCYW